MDCGDLWDAECEVIGAAVAVRARSLGTTDLLDAD